MQVAIPYYKKYLAVSLKKVSCLEVYFSFKKLTQLSKYRFSISFKFGSDLLLAERQKKNTFEKGRHFFNQKVICLNKIKVVFIRVEIKLDYLLAKDRIKRSLNLEVMCE